jgi:hypothetical protein
LVGADVTDTGVVSDGVKCRVDSGRSDAATSLDEQQVGSDCAASVGEPFVEQHLDLWVERDVAVVVELADRDSEPIGGTDLNDGVDCEAEQFAFAHAGAGEYLDSGAGEQVGVSAGGDQQFR